MTTGEADESPSAINRRDQIRIQRAFDSLPYSGMLLGTIHGIKTVDDLVTVMEQFAVCLRVEADNNKKKADELYRLRVLMDGGRDLLQFLLGKDEQKESE